MGGEVVKEEEEEEGACWWQCVDVYAYHDTVFHYDRFPISSVREALVTIHI